MSRTTLPGGALSQSVTSLVSDLAYFALVGFLGWSKVVDGQAIVALLGFYGAGRVTIGMRKTEARSAYYEGAANASGQMRAVRAPIVEEPPRDDDDDPGAPPKRASGTGTLIAPLAPPARPGRDQRRDPSEPPPPPRIPRPTTRFDASPVMGALRLIRRSLHA